MWLNQAGWLCLFPAQAMTTQCERCRACNVAQPQCNYIHTIESLLALRGNVGAGKRRRGTLHGGCCCKVPHPTAPCRSSRRGILHSTQLVNLNQLAWRAPDGSSTERAFTIGRECLLRQIRRMRCACRTRALQPNKAPYKPLSLDRCPQVHEFVLCSRAQAAGANL